jgi:GT2 family glycosyltransferase
MTIKSIATLITCYNRKQKTLDSLKALFSQTVFSQVALSIYLVDDGSTDGTAEAIQAAYPQVILIKGSGNLFWNGGMRTAFAAALEQDHDYYLWLNDDTSLYPEALKLLLSTSDEVIAQGHSRAIIVGSTQDSETGAFTYGGFLRGSWWRPLRFPQVEPGDKTKPCDTINGNCVLIPRSVAQVVGNLDPAFTHYMGDIDYGLRAQKQGCTVWIAPGYIGTCSENLRPRSLSETISDLPWYQQWKRIGQPKGLNFSEVTLTPLNEWKVFTQRHGGPLWPIYWLFPYIRVFLIPFVGIFRQLQRS